MVKSMSCVAVCDSNFFEMFMSENYQQSDKLELVELNYSSKCPSVIFISSSTIAL